MTEINEQSKRRKPSPDSGEGQKWTMLHHNGLIFPPPYTPHGVKMIYKGKPVDLTPEQEEVATMFAVMLDTDHVTKLKFKENFMSDWKKILGKEHIIQNLEDCDFTPIYEWHQREKEKKRQMSTEEKKALKEEKLNHEEKYKWAIVDGVKEKVGNFRIEPPGLFRSRGEHPKMGKLKERIYPKDITINIWKDAPIPECPLPGESWKEIRHDNTVTWLAYWRDPISPAQFEYMFIGPRSALKGQSDEDKYEKSRALELRRETKSGDAAEKIVVYEQANKEVAIICNHQRTVSKSHSAQMLELNEKMHELGLCTFCSPIDSSVGPIL